MSAILALETWDNRIAGTSSAITDTIADGRRGASPTSAAVGMSGGTSSMTRDAVTGRFLRTTPVLDGTVQPDDRNSLEAALGVALVEVAHTPDRGPCWVPQAPPEPNGYVRLKRDGRRRYVHRLAMQAVGRSLPAGMHTDHLCRNRACCRPRHLDVVTPRVNTLRGMSPSAVSSMTGVCQAGLHALTPDNLVAAKRRVGLHVCLACRREYERRRRRVIGHTPQMAAAQRARRERRKAAA